MASKTYADFRAEVEANLQDKADELDDADKNVFIRRGIEEIYSKDKPKEVITDVTGSGVYSFDMPSTWIKGFSTIRQIEYPANDQTPTIMDERDYGIIETTVKQQIRFYADTPTSSQTIRFTTTAPYLFSSNAVTIPGTDFGAICNLATALCLDALANRYAMKYDATLSADMSGRPDQALRDQAQRYMKAYRLHLGLSADGTVGAACIVGNLDTSFIWGGDYLTHPKAWR